MVAGGGPAAANLGRLASNVSARLGFRAPGSTACGESSRAYLYGTPQDADLLAAEGSLGLGRSGGGGGDAMPTAFGLRSAGQTLGRQVRVWGWGGRLLMYFTSTAFSVLLVEPFSAICGYCPRRF